MIFLIKYFIASSKKKIYSQLVLYQFRAAALMMFFSTFHQTYLYVTKGYRCLFL